MMPRVQGTKVSIVTVSYNQARFLEQAILSVLMQDYPNLQYILVDPGSTDGSREIIERYRDRIDQVIFEQDGGPSDGLNKGFRKATGDVFAYLNSDDLLLPGTVAAIAQVFERRPNVDVVSGHGLVIDADDRVTKRIYSHRFSPRMYAYGACILVQQSTFFKRAAFQRVGGFNSTNRVSWDSELWVDLALNRCEFARINRFLSAFRIYGESITGSGKFVEETAIEHKRICAKIGAMHPSRFRNSWWWLLNRLSDPVVTSLRLCDAVAFGQISHDNKR